MGATLYLSCRSSWGGADAGGGDGLGECPESRGGMCAITSPESGRILSMGLGVLVCEVGL